MRLLDLLTADECRMAPEVASETVPDQINEAAACVIAARACVQEAA